MFEHRPASSHRACAFGQGGRSCDHCREVYRRVREARRAKAQKRFAEDPSIRPHGMAVTYQYWGCRCDQCKTAANSERRRYAPFNEAAPRVKPRTRTKTRPFGREWLDNAD